MDVPENQVAVINVRNAQPHVIQTAKNMQMKRKKGLQQSKK